MTSTVELDGPGHDWAAAYEAVREEMAALPERQLLAVNLDINDAMIAAIGNGRELRSLREQVATLVPASLALFDRMETYALAAAHANLKYKAASDPQQPLPEMAAELVKLRELFIADVTALGKRGLLEAAPLEKLRGAVGYVNLSADVQVLALMLRNAWPTINGRTAVQLAELDRAEDLVFRFMQAVGDHQQAPPDPTGAALARRRAFTLFMRAYEEVRRAVGYLRYHQGDAKNFAPNLYSAGGKKRKKKKKPAAAKPDAGR